MRAERVMSAAAVQRVVEQITHGDRGEFSRMLGIDPRVLRFYLAGERAVPWYLAIVLRALRDGELKPSYLFKLSAQRWRGE